MGGPQYDDPDACVPLCKRHHQLFDAHRLELLPYLSLDEQLATVKYAGGIRRAYDRLTYNEGRPPCFVREKGGAERLFTLSICKHCNGVSAPTPPESCDHDFEYVNLAEQILGARHEPDRTV
jgi:hypothetical protein